MDTFCQTIVIGVDEPITISATESILICAISLIYKRCFEKYWEVVSVDCEVGDGNCPLY